MALKIKEKTTLRLVLTSTSLQSYLVKVLVVSVAATGFLTGIIYTILSQKSNTGYATTLTCDRPEDYINCRLSQVDAKSKITMDKLIPRVAKAIVQPQIASRQVCSGRGEDRSCETIEYYICHVNLVNRNGIASIPLKTFAPVTTNLEDSCELNTALTMEIDNLVKGNTTKTLQWREDNRIGDLSGEIRTSIGYVALAVSAIMALSLLDFTEYTWIFDKQAQEFKLLQKRIFGTKSIIFSLTKITGIKTERVSTKNPSYKAFFWLGEGNDPCVKKSELLAKALDYTDELLLKQESKPYLNPLFRFEQIGIWMMFQSPQKLEIKKEKKSYWRKIVYVIDRSNNILNYLPDQTKTESFPISDIQSFSIEEAEAYHLELLLKDGRSQPISELFEEYELDKTIAKWLADYIELKLERSHS